MTTARKSRDTTLEKQQLREAMERGEISLGEAVRCMRRISEMSQKAYAQKIVGVSPRVLAEIELDRANPTVETLNKIGRPFGYEVGFVHK